MTITSVGIDVPTGIFTSQILNDGELPYELKRTHKQGEPAPLLLDALGKLARIYQVFEAVPACGPSTDIGDAMTYSQQASEIRDQLRAHGLPEEAPPAIRAMLDAPVLIFSAYLH